MNQSICAQCGSLFLMVGDDWYEINRMHDDRVGDGPNHLCSKQCAALWIAEQEPIATPQ